jgi:hypothetical protein
MDYREDTPVLIGSLTDETGAKGFINAKPGHPVFEVKDRYVIFLRSEVQLREKSYNPITKQQETQTYYYDIAVPYYKKTLEPFIVFNNNQNTEV